MIAIEQRTVAPSVAKYGTIILEDGFTQLPRSVEDYLNYLDLCSTAIRLLFILMSYRRTAEQEIFPSVRDLAARCKVSSRRINQLTAQLVQLGLIIKSERFSSRSQIANFYDLEPLFEKVAAWKCAKVAAEMAEDEARADEPFEAVDLLEQAAQIVSEQFGEEQPRQIRYNVRRLDRRWSQHPQLEWQDFSSVIEKAAKQTEKRRAEPTKTGHAFEKLVPYFFSALDYRLSLMQKRDGPAIPPTPQKTTQSQDFKNKEQQPSESKPNKGPQQPKKSGLLAERAAARKAAEADGQRKVRPPETLALHIKAAATTFNDDQERSSVQRASNIMVDARLDEQTMLDLIAQARAAASNCTQIKRRNKNGKINRMPYFFQVLEELVSKEAEEI